MQQLWQNVLQEVSVSSTIESMRQNVWAYEILPKIPAQTLIKNWIELYYVSLRHSKCDCHENLVCRSLRSLLLQWRVHGCWRRDIHHIVEGTIGNILGVGENQVDLERVLVPEGTGTATVQGQPATLPCSPHV
jgi:hypothetical protein